MKKIIYILSVVLLAALAACTEDSLLPQEPDGSKNGYVTLRFTLEDIPDFKEVSTKAGETAISSLSLMTFAENGNFLGRVEATDIIRTENNEATGSAKGTATALIPVNTKTIHFVANYPWNGNEYKTPLEGQTETSVMPALRTSSPYVAWGYENITDYQNVSVTLLRNYAKVEVNVNLQGDSDPFEIDGFALANYVSEGTVTPWNEEQGTFNNVTSEINKNTQITQIEDYASKMLNHTTSDCNLNPKYMFEYQNNYDNQTCVIIKKKGVDQYYKIQLIDQNGDPFIIERNYIYKVVIVKFTNEATGSASFEEALRAAPTNNIFAEVAKEAPTVSDANGNKLTVTPLFHLFTEDGTLTFDANYWRNGTSLSNSDINVSMIQNGHTSTGILSDLSTTVRNDGKVTASVSVPYGIDKLDSATVLIKAGILTRIVTVYASKKYSFEPVIGDDYFEDRVGETVSLKFNIPSDYPSNLYPVKCYIKAEDLNPVTTGQDQMLIEHRDGTYYYVYLATAPGQQTVYFKTTRSTVANPTVNNDYFYTGKFVMSRVGLNDFSNISAGHAYYESGSTFDITFNAPVAASVTISGDGIKSKTVDAIAGVNTVTLVTSTRGAKGTIYLRTEGYNDGTTTYSNNSKLQRDYTVEGILTCKRKNNRTENVSSGTISINNKSAEARIDRENHYEMILKAGILVTDKIKFTVSANGYWYNSSDVIVSNFFGNNTNMTCTR